MADQTKHNYAATLILPSDLEILYEFESLAVHGVVETVRLEDVGGKTKISVKSCFMTVEDRDGMIESGMESGATESWERLAELLAQVRPGQSVQ